MTYIAKRSLIAAIAALAFTAPHPITAVAGPDTRQVIEDRLQQYEDHFNAKDAEALARLFSEDVIYYGPLGAVFEGRDAVERRYQRSFEAGFSDMTVETIEIGVLDDTAWDIARYTITGPNGDPLEGYHLAILEKVDGDWFVKRTLVNAVMPEPPPR